MAESKNYDGSTNPFDDPDEVVTESPQEYTGLQLSENTCHNKSSTASNDQSKVNNNTSYSQKTTTTSTKKTSTQTSSNTPNSSKTQATSSTSYQSSTSSDKKFLDKTKDGFNNVLNVTSEKVGKPIISISQKMNKKITNWLGL